MSYWQHVQSAAGMGGRYQWVLLGCVVAALVLGAIAPHSRRRLRTAVLLVGVSLAGILICGILRYRGILEESAAGYRWIHYGAQLALAAAVIGLSGVLVFRML